MSNDPKGGEEQRRKLVAAASGGVRVYRVYRPPGRVVKTSLAETFFGRETIV